MKNKGKPNKADAQNPAMTSLFQVRCHRRRVCDLYDFMPEDWDHYFRVLVDSSKAALVHFFEKEPTENVNAIGYVFELWNLSPSFNLCANVGPRHDQRLEVRWNSGDYKYPAGLLGTVDELGSEWIEINTRLHQLAEKQDEDGVDGETYRGMIDLSVRAMIQLARSGMFGDSKRLDFNVSEVSDNLDIVIARNRLIHEELGRA